MRPRRLLGWSGLASTGRVWLRGLALRLGLDVRRFHPASAPSARRARLLATKDIDLVIDGGASFGQYGRLLRASGYQGSIVSFEPLPQPFAVLSRHASHDPDWRCYNLALGDTSGVARMNVARNTLSSSILAATELHQVNAPSADTVGAEEVEVASLDDVADGFLDASTTAFLKLDLQGYELAALRGAETTLSQVRAVEAELSLAELYRGQPLLLDVCEHLRQRGFGCVGLDPVMVDRTTGYLLQVDGLFVR
jgi:FkbM family methyltransferase